MNSDEYWFWLLTKEELSSIDIRKLLAAYPAPEDIFKAAPEDLITRSGISPDKANAVADPFLKDDHLLRYDRMCSSGIRLIHLFSPEYPEKLKNIPDSPCGLFVKGNLPDPDIPALGMVGARACSGYGSKMAHETARKLSSYGIQTVSGMAVGIDSVCARSTLDAGGKTFAILGSGIDVIYPKENIELYYNIIMSGGGIISEYPMGSVPYPWRFPHRNRLISGLSDVLLVIEAGKRSGTLTTAMHALDQGKDVYALPGRITDPLSEGCNRMIADGAGVLLDPDDLLEDYFGFRLGGGKYILQEGRDIETEPATKRDLILRADRKSVV